MKECSFMQNNLTEPFEIFSLWYEEAKQNEINDPNAMSLATIGQDGFPNVRIVLLKSFTENGFVFYTNFNSTKGQELQHCPHAALCFHWKSLQKQIRIQGSVEIVKDSEADEYFNSRPYLSKIGAWASQQSQPLKNNLELSQKIAYFTKKFALGEVPRPAHWSGFRVKPCTFEFWEAGKFRIHKRQKYYLSSKDYKWCKKTLYP